VFFRNIAQTRFFCPTAGALLCCLPMPSFIQPVASRTLLRAVAARCALCGGGATDALCEECAADLPRLENARLCPVCADGVGGGGEICGRCLKKPPAFDATVAVFAYSHPADRLIQKFKQSRGWPLAAMLSRLCAPRFADAPRPDMLLAIPLHKKRERERGFNQAGEFAKPLARLLSLPPPAAGLRRVKAMEKQAAIQNEARRRANARHAFFADNSFAGASVAVIDDVMTSGATLNDAARALKRAGAKRVYNWVVARAERIKPR
jgi:ComF family protein